MKKIKFNGATFIIGTILCLWGFLIFYPFYNSVLTSFMTQAEYMRSPFALFVKEPTLVAYEEIFSDSKFFYGYKNVLIIMLFKLPISLTITVAMGYALSRKRFLFSKFINNILVFSMYFGGGIIPLYLTMKEYGLMDSRATIVILGIFSVYNMIMFKNFFYTIPDALEESARIDGANDLRIFAQIFVPLAKPIIATVALWTAVKIWNEWYNSMIFLNDAKKWPLQLVLREIINNATSAAKEDMESEELKETFALNVQMAAVVVTMLPIMLVYPFLQKYFMSGLTVGAVKG